MATDENDPAPELAAEAWECDPVEVAERAQDDADLERECDGFVAPPAPVPDDDVEALAEVVHAQNCYDSDDCDHGTYQGGPSHGEPYRMCERMARTILASGWLAQHTAAAVDAALAAPHDCEGQRQLASLATVFAKEPSPEVVAEIQAKALAQQREELAQAIEALPCPGSPPDPLAEYAFETAKSRAVRVVREFGEGR